MAVTTEKTNPDGREMASFDVPKSPGGPGSFGGSSKRLENLAVHRIAFHAKDSFKVPGPGDYNTEAVLGFDHSNLSGVTASFSRIQPIMSGRYSTGTASTRSFGGSTAGDDTPIRPSELVTMAPAVGPQVDSRKTNSASFTIAKKHALRRERTPGTHDYVIPSPVSKRAALIGTDDRFGDSGPETSPTRRYCHTPTPTQYNHHDSYKSQAIAPPPMYTMAQRYVHKKYVASPGPHVAGEYERAHLAVLPSAPAITMAAKRLERSASTPGVGQYDARAVYWSNKKPLGRSYNDYGPLPIRPPPRAGPTLLETAKF